ncbi:MAG: hypothetical protein EBZ77_09240, partial [Chitinophagia bacterium]|nr:hypothetical protein [Chitinophagia bacterium]
MLEVLGAARRSRSRKSKSKSSGRVEKQKSARKERSRVAENEERAPTGKSVTMKPTDSTMSMRRIVGAARVVGGSVGDNRSKIDRKYSETKSVEMPESAGEKARREEQARLKRVAEERVKQQRQAAE